MAVSLALPAVLAGCADSDKASETPREEFVGTVVYEASAGGPNKEGAEMFNGLWAKREAVTWGSGGRLRLETTGGMFDGITVARVADSAFFALDTAARVAHPARLESMNVEDIDPKVLPLIQSRVGLPEMQRTDEEGNYAGRRCRMYRVRRSGMMRRGATGRACLAEDIHTRPTRYHFTPKGGVGQMAPLPLQFGIREGLPLMLEVNENNTIVTYRAVSVIPGEPADSLFSVPPGYTVETPQTDG